MKDFKKAVLWGAGLAVGLLVVGVVAGKASGG